MKKNRAEGGHPRGPAPIVVADAGQAASMLRQHLPDTYPIAHASTLAAAKALVTADTPLVLCDCHFDDGRMYELLRWLRGSAPRLSIPFLAVRFDEGHLDDSAYDSLKVAVGVAGGDGFVDLFRWRVQQGPARAAERLARRVEVLLHGGTPEPD